MKKAIFIIAMIVALMSISYSQTYEDKGSVYTWKWTSGILDSAESENSPSFPAYDFIGLYAQLPIDTGEVDSDTKFVEFIQKPAYVVVQVKGTGTVDSLSSLYLAGRTPSDAWVVIDTMSTAKETSCMTKISYNDMPRFTELRFQGTVADLTVSAYNVRIYVELIIPKVNANGGVR